MSCLFFFLCQTTTKQHPIHAVSPVAFSCYKYLVRDVEYLVFEISGNRTLALSNFSVQATVVFGRSGTYKGNYVRRGDWPKYCRTVDGQGWRWVFPRRSYGRCEDSNMKRYSRRAGLALSFPTRTSWEM